MTFNYFRLLIIYFRLDSSAGTPCKPLTSRSGPQTASAARRQRRKRLAAHHRANAYGSYPGGSNTSAHQNAAYMGRWWNTPAVGGPIVASGSTAPPSLIGQLGALSPVGLARRRQLNSLFRRRHPSDQWGYLGFKLNI